MGRYSYICSIFGSNRLVNKVELKNNGFAYKGSKFRMIGEIIFSLKSYKHFNAFDISSNKLFLITS